MGVPRTPPKSSPTNKTTTLQTLFDLESNSPTTTATISSNSQTQELLSIISYCTSVFSFADPSESPYQQDLKRLKLSHLLASLKSSKPPLALDDRILSPLFSVIAADLLRPLPPCTTNLLVPADSAALLDDDDDPLSSYLSPAWPHLHLVYDILLRLVLHSDPNSLRPHVDRPFLLALLSLFQTEDRRERECLKNVFHRIYSRFTFHRSFMRKAMKDVFLQHVFDAGAADCRHPGIGELLEVWGSIINGFGVPLREEHKVFLTKVLLPMHKCKGMQAYHRQLAYCVSQFLQKEPMLGVVVVRGILKHWPITNCQREVLLLGELEELVDYMDQAQYAKLASPLCSQVSKCLNSWNSQVKLARALDDNF
ncbi:hypothetical protein ACLOJK_008199 [Asimina triloba]